MLLEFSNATTISLKAHSFIAQLGWSNENKLDLASIKQLKGCRTKLVQSCLIFIQKLDASAKIDSFNSNEKKNYALQTTQKLLESLKKYKESSERHPRIKNFLNIIPDNTNGIVGFILIISSLITTLFPPLAIIPLIIVAWVLIDLFFNNREEAKNLKEILFTAKDELSTIETATDLLTKKRQSTQTQIAAAPIPSTSGTKYNSIFYRSGDDQSETSSINSTSSFTLTS
ncbi:MAG: hypothetical protein WA659_00840 [Candidatus Aquirickettsiella sp.]